MGRFATRIAASACLAGLVGVLVSLLPGVLAVEEDPGLRWLLELRGAATPPESTTVIAISRDSAEALGVSADLDEWPRSLHAQLIERLDALGAAVIVFDVMFEEPGEPDEDARLAAAIREAGNVVLLEWVDSVPNLPNGLPEGTVLEQRTKPHEPLARAALATAPFTLPTRPLRTSQFWTFGRADDSTPSLPAVVLQAFALPDYERFVEDVLETPQREIPFSAEAVEAKGLAETVRSLRLEFLERPEVAERAISGAEDARTRALIDLYTGPSSRYLNFYGPTRTIRTIPFESLVPGSGEAGQLDLTGQAVFVGYSELRQPAQEDDFLSVYSEASGLNLSGVEMAATAFANLLERNTLAPLPRASHLLFVFVWGAGLALALAYLRTSAAIALGLAAGTAFFVFAEWRLAAAHVWWPTIVPLGLQLPAAVCLVAYWNHARLRLQRERIQKALGYYVPNGVLRRLVRESVEEGARRELVYGTCLVTDVERFTTLSERLGAEALGELMASYYDALAEVVRRHDGFVADVSGDSIVGIWTAMRSRTEARRAAAMAALEMRVAIEAFNVEHAPYGLPTRFGLDSGSVLVGNIGIAQRYEYRAIGDIVNTASRIQGLNRALGTRVLASAASIENQSSEVMTRAVGRFLLVGKSTPIDVYELLKDGHARGRDWIIEFETALRAFAARRWDTARAGFRAVLALRSDDGPSRYYLEQCDRFQTRELPADWAGAIRTDVK